MLDFYSHEFVKGNWWKYILRKESAEDSEWRGQRYVWWRAWESVWVVDRFKVHSRWFGCILWNGNGQVWLWVRRRMSEGRAEQPKLCFELGESFIEEGVLFKDREECDIWCKWSFCTGMGSFSKWIAFDQNRWIQFLVGNVTELIDMCLSPTNSVLSLLSGNHTLALSGQESAVDFWLFLRISLLPNKFY